MKGRYLLCFICQDVALSAAGEDFADLQSGWGDRAQTEEKCTNISVPEQFYLPRKF